MRCRGAILSGCIYTGYYRLGGGVRLLQRDLYLTPRIQTQQQAGSASGLFCMTDCRFPTVCVQGYGQQEADAEHCLVLHG